MFKCVPMRLLQEGDIFASYYLKSEIKNSKPGEDWRQAMYDQPYPDRTLGIVLERKIRLMFYFGTAVLFLRLLRADPEIHPSNIVPFAKHSALETFKIFYPPHLQLEGEAKGWSTATVTYGFKVDLKAYEQDDWSFFVVDEAA